MDPTVAHHPARGGDQLTPLLLAVLVTGSIIFLWFAVSADEVFMAVHVTAATVWVGGGTALTIFALLTERAHDPQALANLVRHVEVIAVRFFTPASLIALASGVVLVEKDGSGYGSFWISFALAVWAASFVLGAFLIGPRSSRLRRVMDERGVDDVLVQAGIAQILRLARIDVTMLLLVVIDMAAKPSF